MVYVGAGAWVMAVSVTLTVLDAPGRYVDLRHLTQDGANRQARQKGSH